MLLYHGSPIKIDKLERRQAGSPNSSVPEGELLDAIYFTPDLAFAIACAGRPKGETHINHEEKTIEFENPKLFNPEQDIYIYSIESEKIPLERIRKVDERQFAIIGLDEIVPDNVENMKAIEIKKYYNILNWKEGDEIHSENKFKIR